VGEGTIAIALRGPLGRADLPALMARFARELERSQAELAVCELIEVEPDAVALDALARLRVVAHRCGCELHVHEPSDELVELLALSGLGELV
jgi:ABC-type transporter Mla MlaB component